eukprot:2232759-Prymnesium_polylepis.1
MYKREDLAGMMDKLGDMMPGMDGMGGMEGGMEGGEGGDSSDDVDESAEDWLRIGESARGKRSDEQWVTNRDDGDIGEPQRGAAKERVAQSSLERT